MVEKERKRGISKESFRRALRIFRYVWPHRLKFCIGVVFLFLSAFTFMTFPGLLGRLIGGDEVSDSPIDQFFSLENVNQIALLLLAAFALQALFSFLRIYLFADVTERAIAKIRQDVYQHIIQLPMTFFNRERVGELNSRISNDISQLQETFMTTLAELIRQAVIIIFGVTLLFFYSIELTFVMLVSLPVMMLAAFFFGKFIRRLSKATQDELARSQVVVEETLQGIQSVKAYVNEPHEISRYFNVTENVRTVAMKAAKWRGAFASFIIFGLFDAIVLVIWYGVKLKNAGEIGLDELTSFILYSVFVGGSIGGVADIFGKVQKAIGSTENLFDLMEEEKEKLEHDSAIPSVSTKNKLKGKIQFDHVQFAYATRADKTVLDDVSFKIEAGERVAIVGSSGSGKSTIASLLYRFYDPNSGSILFDDQDSRSMDLKSLRDNLALVPQEVLLFGGSIRENIAYGKTTATEEEIFEAAAKANALEFIESFPDKFETLVGERGVQLSGGQRQRVAIARAILKDPSILILDEATSALDSESELLVQDALDRLMEGRTSIIIAHRLSTVRKASNILVIDRGEVSESGTHSELIKIENGLYRKLSEMQVLA